MKIKVSEASGPALDWMVAACEGHTDSQLSGKEYGPLHTFADLNLRYSTDWSQAGPIIEREGIEFRASGTQASIVDGRTYYGPTHLIAAMRCYVASKLGDEVEVPDDLTA